MRPGQSEAFDADDASDPLRPDTRVKSGNIASHAVADQRNRPIRCELLEQIFSDDPRLEGLEDWVEDSGEGRWTIEQAIESGVPAEVLTISLMRRFRSRQPSSFSDRLVAALRNAFGGHAVCKKRP